jgi:hypothetical protein
MSPRPAILTLLLALSAAGAPALAEGGHHAPQLGLAHFDVFQDGDTLHLLTGYRNAEEPGVALWYRRSSDGGVSWSEPARVNGKDEELFAPHPGENPQIAARGDRVLALWSSMRDDKPGPLVTAYSDDGGKTWKRGPNPASDGADDYHPLPELGAGPDGFHAVWLHRSTYEGPVQQGLHAAHSADGKRWSATETVDQLSCECCWNRVVVGKGRVGVLYRGAEPRDMKFAGWSGAQWSEGTQVGRFDWDFGGCPHTGGGLAQSADGKRLHALVWTGLQGQQGLYYVASNDGGASWSDARRLGGEDAVDGDIALAPDGRLQAVWDDGAAILGAGSGDGGASWSEPATISDGGERNRHPRTFATTRGRVTFWMQGAREATVLKSTAGVISAPGLEVPPPVAP